MSPRALLLTGLGTLLVGLVLVASVHPSPDVSAPLVRSYLSHACELVGVGLVLLAAYRAERRVETPPPSVDHYA